MPVTRMSIVCAVLTLVTMPLPAAARPPDVRPGQGGLERAVAAWQSALSAHAGCIGTVAVRFDTLDGRRGEYRSSEHAVVIDHRVRPSEIPALAVHQLGHHVFESCGLFDEGGLTTAFYRAQGIPAGRGWFDDSRGWSSTPAELFAEALTIVVLGRSSTDARPEDAAVEVVARWAAGRDVGPRIVPPEAAAITPAHQVPRRSRPVVRVRPVGRRVAPVIS